MEDRRGLLLPFPEIILFSPAPATEESRYSSSSAPPAPVAEVVVYSSSFDVGEVCGLDKEGKSSRNIRERCLNLLKRSQI